MRIDSFSRTLFVCLLSLVLVACGGGGGGGGGSTIIGGPGDGEGGDGAASTGTVTLAISGMVDENGQPDNVLAGNEVATLTAQVTENGAAANLVVLFTTTQGRLLQSSAQSVGGTASVEIAGDGTAGGATVTAGVTLSDGTEVEASIVVQMSADSPSLELLNADGSAAETIELRAAETAQVTARVTDWDGTALPGVGVTFSADALNIDTTSGVTDNSGEVLVTLTGTEIAVGGTLTATATFSSFELDDSSVANSLGVNTEDNRLSMTAIDVGTDGVLDGNEKVLVEVSVFENGVERDGISVTFVASGGSLTNDSHTSGTASPAYGITTGTPGVARAQLVGDGMPGTVTVTANATLSNGITVTDQQTVQATAETPTLVLLIKNKANESITSFGGNQELDLEATITDFDGGQLDASDAGVSVEFDVDGLGELVNSTIVTQFEACPVNSLIKEPTDCATVPLTSNATELVATITATATINGIMIMDSVTATNTGQNSGAPDQNSFTITRSINDLSFSTRDTVAVEGDVFNNAEATIRVDLADFFNNPVPDGTLVEFTAELGDITNSCETDGGQCDVTYFSADPRAPDNTEVSFKQLPVDDCPSSIVYDETVVPGGGDGQTDYRVREILRVASGTTVLTETTHYEQRSWGFECVAAPCTNGANLSVTYRRLWLDEEDDSDPAHVLLNPGAATEPFLAVRSTPCLAPARENIERITGAIDPDGDTSVTGVGTQFQLELAVGDRLKVNNQVSMITAIASDTALTVATAFEDGGNDVSPERIAAPAYLGGMGQPYGGRSTILAYAIGEESFVDVNGNDEYDFGESFEDLSEAFLDKNEDGVLNDVNGDSATAATVGPYRDAGLGTDAPGEAREKSNPSCYGPKTIIGEVGGSNDSTEAQVYCYQDGGEEELFIDNDSDGVMDVGNGIYNGSRCLRPEQEVNGVLTTVCTTELLNISREAQILLAGTTPYVEFRTIDDGGSNGGGEIVERVELAGGSPIPDTSGTPTDWTIADTTAVTDVTIQKGADVDTTTTALGAVRDVELFTIESAFTTSNASWTLEFQIDHQNVSSQGGVEVFAAGQRLTFDAGAGAGGAGGDEVCGESGGAIVLPQIDTCRVSGFTVPAPGDLIIASADGTLLLIAEISEFEITGVTGGNQLDYEIINSETVTSTDLSNTGLVQFDIGDSINATTAFPGVSETLGNGGTVPRLSTTITNLWVNFTDVYNGQLPFNTSVVIESDNSQGCTLAAVNGVAVNSNDPGADSGSVHSGEVTVGGDVDDRTFISLTTGFGAGALTATITPPSGIARTFGITCEL